MCDWSYVVYLLFDDACPPDPRSDFTGFFQSRLFGCVKYVCVLRSPEQFNAQEKVKINLQSLKELTIASMRARTQTRKFTNIQINEIFHIFGNRNRRHWKTGVQLLSRLIFCSQNIITTEVLVKCNDDAEQALKRWQLTVSHSISPSALPCTWLLSLGNINILYIQLSPNTLDKNVQTIY